MKIERNGLIITLTEQELKQAYEEYERTMTKEYVQTMMKEHLLAEELEYIKLDELFSVYKEIRGYGNDPDEAFKGSIRMIKITKDIEERKKETEIN